MINFNLDWLSHPLAFYATLLIGGAASMQLIISMRADLRRRQQSQQAENATLKEAIEALRGKVEALTLEGTTQESAHVGVAPGTSLNVNQRAAALRMYGRGSDSHTVSAALKLPRAETELLRKVHHILRAEN
jgi:hypothetical protein